MAVVIFGIVLAAINTVFYAGLRLRNRTADALDVSHSVSQALTLLRRDLQNILPPGGVMSPSFKIGPVSASLSTPQTLGIEFYASTGVIDDKVPWGDVQKVIYQLREPLDSSRATGKDLVRSVTRNLLATTTEEPATQLLLSEVETMEFLAFSGRDWRASWDSTMSDTNLPTAIRVRILMAANAAVDTRNRQPMELMIPLTVQARTNAVSSSSGGGQ